MRIRPNKRTGKKKQMSIDQQIQQCEEKIADLENWKRAKAMGELEQQMQPYNGNLESELDKEYEQIALLKIRRMMGY
jgi:U3 small nucleolar ribonucleoprotein component